MNDFNKLSDTARLLIHSCRGYADKRLRMDSEAIAELHATHEACQNADAETALRTVATACLDAIAWIEANPMLSPAQPVNARWIFQGTNHEVHPDSPDADEHYKAVKLVEQLKDHYVHASIRWIGDGTRGCIMVMKGDGTWAYVRATAADALPIYND